MKKLLIFLAVGLLIFLVGELGLFLVGLLPQEPVAESIRASLEQLEAEQEKPYVLHNRERNGIDSFTDCEMLNLTYYLNTRDDASGILVNPIYWRNDITPVDELERLTEGQAANGTYPNYCMGFRLWTRPLLTVFNYMEVRNIGGYAVWILFGFSLITVFRVTQSKFFSALYVLCFAALNPLAISASLTCMTCFILAFLGVMAVPYAIDLRRPNLFRLSLLFFGLGAATQFFDFYTYPLITFAFPMIVLLAADKGDDPSRRPGALFRTMLCGLGAWLAAYIGIWVLKLTATALFTNVDMWGIALNAMDASFGVTSDVGLIRTLTACAKNILTPEVVASLLIVAAVWAVLAAKNPDRRARCAEGLVFLTIGALSVVWILLAKRTYDHRFFQYRTLGVLLLGIFGFMAHTAKPTKRENEIEPE